jgi:hypothetical protein
MTIDTENNTYYVSDVADYTQLATNPNSTLPVSGPGTAPTFAQVTAIGDITTVNGEPAKGTWVFRYTVLNLTPNAQPGQSIADVTRFSLGDMTFEIQQIDGTPVGTLMAYGFDTVRGDAPPPGSPTGAIGGNFAVTGGTGAFLGARGQAAKGPGKVFGRPASVAEDPSFRRSHGGGTDHFILTLMSVGTSTTPPGAAPAAR